MLYRGRIVAQGDPGAMRAHPSEVVQQFLRGSAHGPIDP
jgi:ABC-type transporter Mla maintaining outer membrane lipid asymmetry ATPase subunit MlaF